MFSEQKLRGLLFYLSVCIFLAGLPLILSSSLGYKFDRRALKFTKTGIIFFKTQPAAANIFFDNKLMQEKTPATIRELLPGSYSVRLELEDYYPWTGEVRVEPNKVILLDKIILFPQRPNIKQISKEPFDACLVDEENNAVYYINYADNSVYSSDIEGARRKKTAALIDTGNAVFNWKLSPDREKLLYFNRSKIGITYLDNANDARALERLPFTINRQYPAIEEVFWHSDNYHLVVVSGKDIEVLEAEPDTSAVILVKLNKRSRRVFFDDREDLLYFTDIETAEDGNTYENLYKLDLNAKSPLFPELIKLKSDEQR